MDREHLYRAKRIDNEEWVCGDLIHGPYGTTIQYSKEEIRDKGERAKTSKKKAHKKRIEVIVIPETVCQYTGLPDKNGRKIFEGDIVDLEGAIGIVRFGNYKNGFHYGFYIEFPKCPNFRQEIGYWNRIAKVIGSIFDNPELLQDLKGE